MEIVLVKSFTDKPWRSSSTYNLIERSLKEKWRVHSLTPKDPLSLFNYIRRLQWDHRKKLFVFNIAEYIDEKNKIGFLPQLLDELAIPHFGSSAESIETGLNKAATKELLIKNRIPTPRYFVVKDQKADIKADIKRIGFPLIVKPVSEGGHIGIKEDSIVYDDVGLNKIIIRVLEKNNQPALVEEFITGSGMREFSVCVFQ